MLIFCFDKTHPVCYANIAKVAGIAVYVSKFFVFLGKLTILT